MQRTSVAYVLGIAQEYFGPQPREKLLRKINEVRRLQWKERNAREMMFHDEGCECIQTLFNGCDYSCSAAYHGFSLPVGVNNVESLKVNGVRIERLEDADWQRGKVICDCGCPRYEVLNPAFLYRDPPLDYKGRLVLRCRDAKDEFKLCGLEYISRKGVYKREDVKLKTDGGLSSFSIGVLQQLTFPRRCGWIDVFTEDSEPWFLGSYHPSVLSPKHLRVRIYGCPCGTTVEWEGLKEPIDVVFDSDMVEFDDPLHWRNSFQFIELHFKQGKSGPEAQAYQASGAMAASAFDSELKATRTVPIANLKPKGVKNFLRGVRWLNSSPYGRGVRRI